MAASLEQTRLIQVRKRLLILVALLSAIFVCAQVLRSIDENVGWEGSGVVSLLVAGLPILSPLLHMKDKLVPASFSKMEGQIAEWIIQKFFIPSASSFNASAYSVPDYSSLNAWAVHYLVNDTADLLPPHCGEKACTKEDQKNAKVDLFFIGPTTHYSSTTWNADWKDQGVLYLIREAIIPQQAMMFNSAARIYSPQIRQMTGFGYLAKSGEAEAVRKQAASIAYSDVRAAFLHYLRHWNEGRKIILAGHSQGSEYLLRLLREEFSPNPRLLDQLFVAYIVGMPVYSSVLRKMNIPPCLLPTSIGCVVSWQTYEVGSDPTAFHFEPSHAELRRTNEQDFQLCTNPLSFRSRDEAYVDKTHMKGGMSIVQWMQNLLLLLDGLGLRGGAKRDKLAQQRERVTDGLLGLNSHLVGARCSEQGYLFVDPPPSVEFNSSPVYAFFPVWRFGFFPGRNLHPYDYNLFWQNIRENVEERVRYNIV